MRFEDIFAGAGVPPPDLTLPGGPSAQAILMLAHEQEIIIQPWAIGTGVSLMLMPMRLTGHDGSSMDTCMWVVDASGAYHHVASMPMIRADSTGLLMPEGLGDLPWQVLNRVSDPVAVVMATISITHARRVRNSWVSTLNEDPWLTTVDHIRCYTAPDVGWLEAVRAEQERAREANARFAASAPPSRRTSRK